ncbi:hypothetical protein POL68_24130 [Stigmatella sp. ncwal1]|uniref:Uncharacterized protein n=1 Tax=Stigmatella ashevillensis TaxID=2995309 RepID=A0ABT5DD16_9BACT|nr:hypothetical protein [Stigmatella ashevillena]MDC0711580.1 hypothetical protein [Stigmatella ashevillena]
MLLPALLATALLAQAPAAPAHRAAATLELGTVLDAAEREDIAYLALERGGIAVVDLKATPPRLLRRIEEGRRFVRLVLAGESLLAVELREEAHAFSLSSPEAPQPSSLALALGATRELPLAQAPASPQGPGEAPPQGPSPAPARTARLTLTAVRGGEVVLSGGRNAGLREGARVRRVPASQESSAREVVLEVTEARETEAVARLGRGESAHVGDLVEPTDAPPSARLFFPQSQVPPLRYGFHARPFLALDAQTAQGRSARAAGVLVDLFAAWKIPDWPVVLSARLEPFGVGLGTGDRHTPGSAYAAATYATEYLEVGLGAGALFGQSECYSELDDQYQPIPGREICESPSGVTVQQLLRLGALDGFHLAWSSSILSRDNQFVFGSGRGELQVPLTSRLALFGAGGGSASGWAFGELGVRSFLKGTGGAGSTVLSVSLGFVSLSDGRGDALAGPSVAFGLERRP